MCGEADPAVCHRERIIAKVLRNWGVKVTAHHARWRHPRTCAAGVVLVVSQLIELYLHGDIIG